ncbi:MAG: D-aminoacylase, partial [Promethearchaeota archaeon]
MVHYDLIIRNGIIYDGSGTSPFIGNIAVTSDRITAIGSFDATGENEIDATNLAVAPGFINMLSWAAESLIEDGR